MFNIFIFLYLLTFLGFVAVGLFILYHFLRYSFSPARSYWGVGIFLAGFLILLTMNVFSFISSLQTLTTPPAAKSSTALPSPSKNSPW